MNKIKIFTIISTFIWLTANSQISKGYWLLGGNADFKSSTEKSALRETTTKLDFIGYNVNPNVGYFILDKLAIGLNANISSSKYNEDKTSVGYGLGPFARYYFLKPDKQINLLRSAFKYILFLDE